MNEALELVRTITYLILALFVFDLGIIVRPARLSLLVIGFQFLMRGMLLFYQVVSPLEYRVINNLISTPSVFIVLICVVINLWNLRRN